jgi:hypothetical protein
LGVGGGGESDEEKSDDEKAQLTHSDFELMGDFLNQSCSIEPVCS